MVLGLVAHRVPLLGARLTGCYSANSSGAVLLPYPGSLTQGALAGGCDLGKRASEVNRPGTLRHISQACGQNLRPKVRLGGTQGVA